VGIYQRRNVQASAKVRLTLATFAIALCVLASGGRAATPRVPFVPTPDEVVERMLTLAKVTKDDYVIDLGSGDGRILRTAARKFGARGFGVDIDEELVQRSRMLARRDGVDERVSFLAQDLLATGISDASVLTMYLLPSINMMLRPRLLSELKPGTRVVSHDFDLGDWEPDAAETLYAKEKYGASGGDSTVYLWIVPADAAGRWSWRLRVPGQMLDFELSVTQHFQKLRCTLRSMGNEVKIEKAELHGDRLSITAFTAVKGSPVRLVFSGRILGDSLEGDVILSGPRLHSEQQWSAVRAVRNGEKIGAALGALAVARKKN
jgi:SAM-dependent methyltransferase